MSSRADGLCIYIGEKAAGIGQLVYYQASHKSRLNMLSRWSMDRSLEEKPSSKSSRPTSGNPETRVPGMLALSRCSPTRLTQEITACWGLLWRFGSFWARTAFSEALKYLPQDFVLITLDD